MISENNIETAYKASNQEYSYESTYDMLVEFIRDSELSMSVEQTTVLINLLHDQFKEGQIAGEQCLWSRLKLPMKALISELGSYVDNSETFPDYQVCYQGSAWTIKEIEALI